MPKTQRKPQHVEQHIPEQAQQQQAPVTVQPAPQGAQVIQHPAVMAYDVSAEGQAIMVNVRLYKPVTPEELGNTGKVLHRLAANLITGDWHPEIMRKDGPAWSERALRMVKMEFFRVVDFMAPYGTDNNYEKGRKVVLDTWNAECKSRAEGKGRKVPLTLFALAKLFKPERAGSGNRESPYARVAGAFDTFVTEVRAICESTSRDKTKVELILEKCDEYDATQAEKEAQTK